MARSFNGSSDQIDTGNSMAGFGITSAYTVNIQIYPTSNVTGSPAADDPAADTGGAIEFFEVAGTPPTFWARCKTGSGTVTISGGSMNLNAWNTIGAVYNGTTFFLYGNGSQITTTAQTGNVTSTGQNVLVGQRGGAAGFGWTGRLADFAVWNVALSAAEMAALVYARPYTVRPSALIIWLPIDGLLSPEPDLSGHAHNGTLTGTTSAFGPPFVPFTPRWPQLATVPAPPPVFTLMPQILL